MVAANFVAFLSVGVRERGACFLLLTAFGLVFGVTIPLYLTLALVL